MPKPPTPIDMALYDSLHAQGLSDRQIAARLEIPPSTLRKRLGRLHAEQQRPPEEDIGVREGDIGIPEVDTETPKLEERLPFQEVREANGAGFNGLHASELAAVWPVLPEIVAWWEERKRLTHAPAEKLTRITYHIRPTLAEAVRREADLTGDSQADIVNGALAAYFAGKE